MATTPPLKPVKTWFPMGRGEHERTLDEQTLGLDPLFGEFRAAAAERFSLTALDMGCAEGLISFEMARAGAKHVHGVELVPDRVKDAQRLRGDLACSFEVGDVATYQPKRPFDVLVALSILHKLPNPSETLRRLAAPCARLVVIRLPPGKGPVVIDPRSENIRHDLNAVLVGMGFAFDRETTSCRGEWLGFWRRGDAS